MKEFELAGKGRSNLIGAVGKIIAWGHLRKMGIFAFKVGSWSFFSAGYPHFCDRGLAFLTREQFEFAEKKEAQGIIDFDLLGVKCRKLSVGTLDSGEIGYDYSPITGVYLIEVKTGRGANIKHYLNNPIRAFSPKNITKAKAQKRHAHLKVLFSPLEFSTSLNRLGMLLFN